MKKIIITFLIFLLAACSTVQPAQSALHDAASQAEIHCGAPEFKELGSELVYHGDVFIGTLTPDLTKVAPEAAVLLTKSDGSTVSFDVKGIAPQYLDWPDEFSNLSESRWCEEEGVIFFAIPG